MSDNIFKRAHKMADSHGDPATRLKEFGVDVPDALDQATGIAMEIILASSGFQDLMLNVASLFMTGVSVGVELPALADDAKLVAEANVAD